MDRWPISDAALELIKEFEGLRLNAYRDPVGIVTIGYGYTNDAGFGPGVSPGDTKAMREVVARELNSSDNAHLRVWEGRY